MSLNNFGVVAAKLYRSAQPDAAAWPSLRALGIGAVVKLDSESEYPAARESAEAGPGIEVASVFINQWRPDAVAVRAAVAQIAAWIAAGLGVLVHCMHGRDRTGLIVGAYRLIEQGWPLEDVERERATYGVVGIIALADHEIAETLEAIAREKT
jgi:protein tyrosine/serine phosphatase